MRVLPYAIASLALVFSGCFDVDVDDDETGELPTLDGPTAEFNPSGSVIPFPNNLLIDPQTGRVNLPEGCNESETQTALREGILNSLDGFGTYKPALSFTLTEPVLRESLEGKVKLYRITDADGVALDPAVAEAVPVALIPGRTLRNDDGCDEDASLIDNVTIVPLTPLAGGSQYGVLLKSGPTTEDEEEFLPSVTWALVRQQENPVRVDEEGENILAEATPFDPREAADVESLLGIDLLWQVHAPVLRFLVAAEGIRDREEVLLAWGFRTQSIATPFDSEVADSPRAALPTDPIDELQDIEAPSVEAVFQSVLGEDVCNALPCAAVASVKTGRVTLPNFQTDADNPLSGGAPIPGAWDDPLTPEQNGNHTVSVFAFVPTGRQPEGGWPVILYGHGLGRSKNDAFAIASQLAATGFATVAMDWVAHGDPEAAIAGRAVQISDDAPLCDGSPDPTDNATGGSSCFAPLFSSNLAGTRDNLRQSVLDALGLVEALKACTEDDCAEDFNIDARRIGYLGHSLGSIIGTSVVSLSSDIRAAVLSVGGVGLTDIIENSDATAFLQCPLLDSLIEVGVLPGTLSDVQNETGTCFEEAWQQFPEWQQFSAIARLASDAGEPANLAVGLRGRAVLVQEVDADPIVPNFSTATLVSLAELETEEARVFTGEQSVAEPSAAITGRAAHVRYTDIPQEGAFPGNDYGHASLLAPEGGTPAGALATGQIQSDALRHLAAALAL